MKITQNASYFANFCNDVVGDIAGTLSGAIGAGIVYSLADIVSFSNIVLAGAAMTSFVAAVTVGGKAIGKSIAINNAETIIFRVAIALGWVEKYTGWELFGDRG